MKQVEKVDGMRPCPADTSGDASVEGDCILQQP